MCGSKGGGSPPVPNASSTSFQSTVSPSPSAMPLYQDFLSRANSMSFTPFNPAMQGQVAPMNALQTGAGNQLFNLGMGAQQFGSTLGQFDPNQVKAIESPYTEDVVNATQDWFNNQNAIQGNDLLSQAIRSGNAFGGDRAGVAQGVLAGQQQLAQAPVIAGLRQAGYGQALQEYNTLKQLGLAGQQFGLQGAAAALGWGNQQQQQAQREFDVAQQNAMMASAYPFQTMNWYGSILGGIAPLMGSQAVGFNTPPTPNSIKTGGVVRHRARGGLVPIILNRATGGLVALPHLAYGGSFDSDEAEGTRDRDEDHEDYAPPPEKQDTAPRRPSRPDFGFGQLRTEARQLPQPTFPGGGGGGGQQQGPITSFLGTASKGVDLLSSGVKLASTLGPLIALSDPKTKTDVQRVGKTDDGEPLYGFRYRGDPKTYPKVVGKMAHPRAWGGYVPHLADGGEGDEEDRLTMTDLGVLSPGGRDLPRSISGPVRGSPGGLPEQAEDMPNLARVRERFRPVLESDPALRRKFDVNTTAEVGTDPEARRFYQALTMDRAAARGEALPYTLSRRAGFYPPETVNATRASGLGVSPSLWGGANPANYGTGNASRDPRTGREVGFAGGPQTASVQTGSGTERAGIEGPDLEATRRWGYTGPSRTTIGARGPQGVGDAYAQASDTEVDKASDVDSKRRQGAAAAPERRDTGSGPVGGTIPGLKGTPERGPVQSLLANPLTQILAGYASGKSPYRAQNLGAAILGAGQLQEQQRKQDILDAKPEMITQGGEIMFRQGNQLIPTGIKTEAAKTAEFERKTQRPFTVEGQKQGPFGSTEPTKESYRYDENGNIVRVPAGQGVAPDEVIKEAPRTTDQPAQGAPQAPQAPQTPQAPQAPQQAPAPAPGGGGGGSQPQVRQSQAAEPTDWQEVGKDTGTFFSPSTGQYKSPEGKITGGTGAAAAPQQAAAPEQKAQKNSTQEGWEPLPIGTITRPEAAPPRNEAALAGLLPGEQKLVKAIANYDVLPEKAMAGKDAKYRRLAMEKVLEYDPSYSASQYNVRAKAKLEYGVGGQSMQNIKGINTVLEHLGDAMTAADKLDNTRFPIWNEITGKWAYQTGDVKYQAALREFQSKAKAAAQEAAKTFRGVGSMSLEEQRLWSSILAAEYDSPVGLRSAMKSLTTLIQGRLNSQTIGHNTAMGPQYSRDAEQWMSPKAQDTVERAYATTPERNEPFPPSRFEKGAARPAEQPGGGGGGQGGQGGGWQRDPATGNYRGPDGRVYGPDGKPLQ